MTPLEIFFKALLTLVEGDIAKIQMIESVNKQWSDYSKTFNVDSDLVKNVVKIFHLKNIKYHQIEVIDLEMFPLTRDGDSQSRKFSVVVMFEFTQNRRDYQLLFKSGRYSMLPGDPEYIAVQFDGLTLLGDINAFYSVTTSENREEFKSQLKLNDFMIKTLIDGHSMRPTKRIETVSILIHYALSQLGEPRFPHNPLPIVVEDLASKLTERFETIPSDILFRLPSSRLRAQKNADSVNPENCSHLQTYLPSQQADDVERNFDGWKIKELNLLLNGKPAAREAGRLHDYKSLFSRAQAILINLKIPTGTGAGREHLSRVLDERQSRPKVLLSYGCYDLETVTARILDLWKSNAERIRAANLSFDDWNNLVNHQQQNKRDAKLLARIFSDLSHQSFGFPIYQVVEYYLENSCPIAKKSGVAFLVHCTRAIETLIAILKCGALLQAGPVANNECEGKKIPITGAAYGYGVYFEAKTRDYVQQLVGSTVGSDLLSGQGHYGRFCLIVSPTVFDRKTGFRRGLPQKNSYPDNPNFIINNRTDEQYITQQELSSKSKTVGQNAYVIFRDKVDLHKYLKEIWVDPAMVDKLRERLKNEKLDYFADLVRPMPTTAPTRRYMKSCTQEEEE